MRWKTVLVLFLLAMIIGCSAEEQVEEEKEPVFPVEIAEVKEDILIDPLKLSGHIVPAQQMPIISPINGKVKTLHVQNGDEVEEGDLLVELDPSDLDLNIEQARTGLTAAEANLENAKAMRESGIRQAQLQLKQAQEAYDMIKAAEAEQTANESDLPLDDIPEELQNILSGLMMNQGAGMDVGQAKLAVDAAQIALEQAQQTASIKAAEASVEQAKISLKMAEQQKEHLRIHAPIAGQITGLQHHEGDFVSPQLPLLQLIQLESAIVKLNLSESHLSQVQLNQEVDIHLPALNQTMKGSVTYISPIPNEGSRSYPVDIQLETDQADLRVGLTAQVTLEVTDGVEQVLIPAEAISQEREDTVIYVTTDGKQAERRLIAVIAENLEWVAVESGVTEGEYVITRGHHQLEDGSFIQVRNGGIIDEID